MAEPRSRTFSWSDPGETLAGITTLPGLEALERMLAGELPHPPIAHLMGMRLVEVVRGRVVWEAVPGRGALQPDRDRPRGVRDDAPRLGDGHGVRLDAEAGTRWTTLELKANFTRAITAETGPVRCTGTVVHRGRTVVTTEARVEDGANRLLAHGTSTILVLAA